MHISLLVASVNGTSTSVAQALQMAAPDLGATLTIVPMEDIDITVFSQAGPFLVCTSTTGAGDLPDTAQRLYQSFDTQPAYLGAVRYGLIALGDSSYGDTFLGGGKQLDAKLQDLGAQRLGDICVLDASETNQPEEDAIAWFTQWIKF